MSSAGQTSRVLWVTRDRAGELATRAWLEHPSMKGVGEWDGHCCVGEIDANADFLDVLGLTLQPGEIRRVRVTVEILCHRCVDSEGECVPAHCDCGCHDAPGEEA